MSDIYNDIIDTGIIEPAALASLTQSGAENIKILDASFYMPGSGQNAHDVYLAEHIEGAGYFDIDGVSDKDTDLPHMLPTPEDFETAVSDLGISNDDLVVIYGQTGILMGPARAWWTFRVFGHDRVCVLNGGLPAWKTQGLSVSDKAVESAATDFKANFRPALVKNLDQVLSASQSQTVQIFDARPAGRFSGTKAEPRGDLRKGHIPGSFSLPCSVLVEAENGLLKTTDEIKALFSQSGFQEGLETITSCGSGVTACVLSLAFHHIGLKDIAVYDGSWSEWGRPDAATPVKTS